MGKKDGLGRALIKNRFGGKKRNKFVGEDKNMLHTADLQDGYDEGRLNLMSVTEETSFKEFMSTAELAGREFEAQKLNIKFVDPASDNGLLSKEEMEKTKDTHDKYRSILTIPRRPPWTPDMTPAELDRSEKDYFVGWRRSLALFQEATDLLLTPYERNLEFWRQLWRVVERSDVVVQIVDARNPLLFRCEDLEKYVKEVSPHKMNLLLINKADFLTEEQRQHWADYFTTIGVSVVFYSATLATAAKSEESGAASSETNEAVSEESGAASSDTMEPVSVDGLRESVEKLGEQVDETARKLKEITDRIAEMPLASGFRNSKEVLTKDGLIELFQTVHDGPKRNENFTVIGLVGYPNVGKSSTINSLFSSKKVSVSATPGKTKHFQTLKLLPDVELCDCPGLVMPSFMFTKAEMVINGILPIDQMRDHAPPVNLVTSLIPRHVIEDKYGIMLPQPKKGEENRSPTAEELLNVYGFIRGFMTARGQPDNARSARYVLKDFVQGKLLYCLAPPGVDQANYHTWPERQRVHNPNRVLPPRQLRAANVSGVVNDDDPLLENETGSNVHIQGRAARKRDGLKETDKPWKKHGNKKKEKLRRVYAHLDQH